MAVSPQQVKFKSQPLTLDVVEKHIDTMLSTGQFTFVDGELFVKTDEFYAFDVEQRQELAQRYLDAGWSKVDFIYTDGYMYSVIKFIY